MTIARGLGRDLVVAVEAVVLKVFAGADDLSSATKGFSSSPSASSSSSSLFTTDSFPVSLTGSC